MEILVKTPRIKELIMQDRDNEIKDALEEGKKIYGTQSFDQHLIDLVLSKKVDEYTAIEYASNKDDFILKLRQAKMAIGADENNDSGVIELKK